MADHEGHEASCSAESGEQFGVRICYQTEDEQIRALEFMLAGRVEEEARQRMARAAMMVRESSREQLAAALHTHHQTSD